MLHHGEPLNNPHPHLESAKKLKDKATEKTIHLLGLGPDEEEGDEDQPYHDAVRELEISPAFNKSKKPLNVKDMADKALGAMRDKGYVIIHPKRATKNKATKAAYGRLAKSWPQKSRQADLDFLEAHDDLARAREYTDDMVTGEKTQGDTAKFEEKIERMEREREETRVAWITARHVRRVRVVDSRCPQFPNVEFFETPDCGYPKFQWARWVAYVSVLSSVACLQLNSFQKLLQQTNCFTAQYIDDFEELPSDLDTLRHHLERLAVVSAPLQTFLSDVRQVYRWEEPVRTTKWMFTYFSLWYISHVMTFFVSLMPVFATRC